MAVFNLAGLAPTVLFTTAQRQLDRPWWRLLPAVLLLSFLGAGMMLTTARAAYHALSHDPGTFDRTPKFGLGGKRREWMHLHYQPPVDKIVFAELALSAFCLYTSYVALAQQVWTVGLYTGVFGLGLGLTAFFTIWQGFGRLLHQHAEPESPLGLEPAAAAALAGKP
jgi:hypothetical protein